MSPSSSWFFSQMNAFHVICEMTVNYNAMMSTIVTSAENLKEESTSNAATRNEKFDELLNYVEHLEQRLGDISGMDR